MILIFDDFSTPIPKTSSGAAGITSCCSCPCSSFCCSPSERSDSSSSISNRVPRLVCCWNLICLFFFNPIGFKIGKSCFMGLFFFRVSDKVSLPPDLDSLHTKSPPRILANYLQVLSPIPFEFGFLRRLASFSDLKFILNRFALSLSEIPMPVSVTVILIPMNY